MGDDNVISLKGKLHCDIAKEVTLTTNDEVVVGVAANGDNRIFTVWVPDEYVVDNPYLRWHLLNVGIFGTNVKISPIFSSSESFYMVVRKRRGDDLQKAKEKVRAIFLVRDVHSNKSWEKGCTKVELESDGFGGVVVKEVEQQSYSSFLSTFSKIKNQRNVSMREAANDGGSSILLRDVVAPAAIKLNFPLEKRARVISVNVTDEYRVIAAMGEPSIESIKEGYRHYLLDCINAGQKERGTIRLIVEEIYPETTEKPLEIRISVADIPALPRGSYPALCPEE